MATTTIKQIYDKAPAAASGDDDILLIAQNEATKGVKLKDVTAGKAVNATDAEYAAHFGANGAPLSVGTEKTPIYIDSAGTPKVCPAVAAATADASAYAQKIGTPQAHPAIGNTSTPIFINDDGIATACTEIHATLANAGSAGIPIYTQGNTIRECANFGVCQTATNVMAKEVQINGFVKKAGAHFYVKFANDGGGVRGTYDLTLNVHDGNASTGAAPVYVGKFQCGIGAINAGCVYEMLFDGEHYVIFNSDIVVQETSENESYIKHGNGLIRQWGLTKNPDLTTSIYYPIAFTTIPRLICGQHSGVYSEISVPHYTAGWIVEKNRFFVLGKYKDSYTNGYVDWIAIGF